MAAPAEKVGWSVLLRTENIPALAALLGGVLLHSMNVLLLATVLPSIVGELGGATMMAWPTTAFLASSIVAASCTGLLSTIVGARGTYCLGAAIFVVGALLCATAPSMALIVAGRFVQGFGGGLLTASAYVLLRGTFPQEAWPRAISLMAAMWSVSILLGPSAGGFFAKLGDWRSAFYCVAVLAVGLIVLAWRALPAMLARTDGPKPGVPIDRVLAICAAIAAMSAAAVFSDPWIKSGLIVLSVALLFVLLKIDRKAKAPLLPSDALSPRTQTGLALWMILLLAIAFSPLQIYLPIFLQKLHGLDPLMAGYVMSAASLGWTVGAIAFASTPEHRVHWVLMGGPIFMVVGLYGVAELTTRDVMLLIPAIVLAGIGIGGCWGFIAQRVMSGAKKGEETIAAPSVATTQQIGFALGGALAGLVANTSGLTLGLERVGIENAAFWTPVWFVVPAGLGLLAAFRLNALVAQRSGVRETIERLRDLPKPPGVERRDVEEIPEGKGL
jgi:MFS family permease